MEHSSFNKISYLQSFKSFKIKFILIDYIYMNTCTNIVQTLYISKYLYFKILLLKSNNVNCQHNMGGLFNNWGSTPGKQNRNKEKFKEIWTSALNNYTNIYLQRNKEEIHCIFLIIE